MIEPVSVKDLAAIFPRPLDVEEQSRAESLIAAADDRIREAFERRGRDLDGEVESTPWLARTYRRVVREMVSAAILIGDNVGRASASSTTGPQSDSVTWSQGIPISWGFIELTDSQEADLLGRRNLPSGGFRRLRPWPEVLW